MIIPICPITSGIKTRMSKESFERQCKIMRKGGAKKKWNYDNKGPCKTYCDLCKGKVPDEVEFVDLQDLKKHQFLQLVQSTKKEEGKTMGSKRVGKCPFCGELKRSLYSVSGKEACSKCRHIIATTESDPFLVASIYKSIQGVDLDESGISAIEIENASLKKSNAELSQHIHTLVEIADIVCMDTSKENPAAAKGIPENLSQHIEGLEMAYAQEKLSVASLVMALEKSEQDKSSIVEEHNRFLQQLKDEAGLGNYDVDNAGLLEEIIGMADAIAAGVGKIETLEEMIDAVYYRLGMKSDEGFDELLACIDSTVEGGNMWWKHAPKEVSAPGAAVIFGGFSEPKSCDSDDSLLDIALAALRGDMSVVADQIEVMRSKV